jgi:hypothetical protein
MIKIELISIVKQLKNHTASLEKSNIFIDKPWTIIDGDNEIQRLIFKKDKTLILSKNGQAQIGKWDYFPEAKSLLIDRISDKILCNEAFIDEGVLILKLDGTDNQFFTLANENVIPNLDISQYLYNIRNEKLFFSSQKLVDGTILDIQRKDLYTSIAEGDKVSINDKNIPDGMYPIDDKIKIYEIKNNEIIQIFTVKNYYTANKKEITVHQKKYWEIYEGDNVFINSETATDQLIRLKNGRSLLIVDGKINKIKWKTIFHSLLFSIVR